jgi:hypothetical protein
MVLWAAIRPATPGRRRARVREAAPWRKRMRDSWISADCRIDDAFMAEMRERFTDAELVELGLVTAAFVMLGRLHRTFGVAPMGPGGHRVLRGQWSP